MLKYNKLLATDYYIDYRSAPDSAQLATALGLLYLEEGKYQHALEKLGGALARDPQYAQALLAAGAMMQVKCCIRLVKFKSYTM